MSNYTGLPLKQTWHPQLILLDSMMPPRLYSRVKNDLAYFCWTGKNVL
jgi:hypothetical protein